MFKTDALYSVNNEYVDKNISTVTPGTKYEANDQNIKQVEAVDLVESSGQTLKVSPNMTPQFGIAAAKYGGGGGDFYTDSGTANAYVLTKVSPFKASDAYFDGQEFVFKAGNSNTEASTVNVSGLGAIDITLPGGNALTSGAISEGEYIKIRYNLANTRGELSSFKKDVDTIADLRLVEGNYQGQTIQPLGYYAIGDGGGGQQRYWDVDTYASSDDNGSTVIVPTGVTTGAWVWVDYSSFDAAWGGVLPSRSDNTDEINNYISAVNDLGGGEIIVTQPGTYLTETIIPKAGVVVSATFGTVIFKLIDSTNSQLVESYLFDTLYAAEAFEIADNANMTLDYGFKGIIFDANGENQTTQDYAVKMYGRRLVFKNCTIANSGGVSFWTAQLGSHDGYDYTKTKTPGDMGEIAIIDGVEEGWIFEGPSDQKIGHVLINVIGDQDNDGTIPQTSTHFPGEAVHGLRVEDAMHLESANVNGIRFGRGIYANARLTFGNIIIAGGWGNFWASATCWGSIDSLLVQANPNDWDSTVYPSIQTDTDDLQIGVVTALRVSGQDQSTAPLILDSGGCNWGLIRNRQALTEGGTFFKADAENINIAVLDAKGAGVALNTTSNCTRINFTATFSNCDVVWDNDATNVRGIWHLTGTLSTGQAFSTGLDSSPNADTESLSRAKIEYYDTDLATYLSNSFRGSESFDSTITTGQSVVFTHNMWRAPTQEEILLMPRVSGWTSEPEELSLSLTSFSSTQVTARIKYGVAAVGSTADNLICRIN